MLETLEQIVDWSKSYYKKSNPENVIVEKLPGDASSRKYYRVRLRSESETSILMVTEPFDEKNFTFLQVQDHLNRLDVPVPQIKIVDGSQGCLLLEDLGDETLLKSLKFKPEAQDQSRLYKKVLDLLLHMQEVATTHRAPIYAYENSFNVERLMWEVNYTLEHFYKGKVARVLPDDVKQRFLKSFEAICTQLASQKFVFTHRDFHSRNIMVQNLDQKDERLTFIDFQDARLGCCQYDLASLLHDAYFKLDETTVEQLVEYYYDQAFRRGLTTLSESEFQRIFDLMTVQRCFKTIGSFSSFFEMRQDIRYLKFIGTAFDTVRLALSRHSEYHELREELFEYYYF